MAKGIYASEEADEIIEANKGMIGKKYHIGETNIIVLSLSKEAAGVSGFKVFVETDSLFRDELYKVITEWPLAL